MKRGSQAAAVVVLVWLLFSGVALATTLGDALNWRRTALEWHTSGGLPVDSEFTAPLAAAYNWAFGAVVLGVTVRRMESNDYYAAMAVDSGDSINAFAILGPLAGLPRYDIGPYHLAVAQPDGRVLVWLTAPGKDPRAVTLTTDALAGTPIACIVRPPEPLSAKWKDWEIVLAYCLNSNGPWLQLDQYSGTGEYQQSLYGQSLPSKLSAVALRQLDGQVGQILFTVLDTAGAGNSPALSGLYLSTIGARGWQTQRVASAASPGGTLHPGIDGNPATACALADPAGPGVVLQGLMLPVARGDLVTGFTGADYRRTPFNPFRFCAFSSRFSTLPMFACSDGVDLWLEWHTAQPGRGGSGLGYSQVRLDAKPDAAMNSAEFPILAVAGAAHWSTGEPTVYWVQQGSPQNYTGQLFKLAFDAEP